MKSSTPLANPTRMLFRAALGLVLALAGAGAARAQYDAVIPFDQTIYDGGGIERPDYVIGIDAGVRGRLILQNIKGTAGHPVIIKNKGGKVRIGNDTLAVGVQIINCSFFEFRGDGDANHKYGIEIFRAEDQGMQVINKSTDFKLCFLHVHNVGDTGISAKTDPTCSGEANSGNFTQYNPIIHDNLIHDTGEEGIYLGSSFYSGDVMTCSGNSVRKYPHSIVGARVYNNRTMRTGREGIQVGCADSDCEIYHNVVIDSGQNDTYSQGNGIQIGEGTTGKCYGNVIRGAMQNGISCLGLGNNLIYNNVIENVGQGSGGGHGIWLDNRPDNPSTPGYTQANPNPLGYPGTIPGSYVKIYNNTIINPDEDGCRSQNQLCTQYFKNNIVVLSDAARSDAAGQNGGGNFTKATNIKQSNFTGLNFVSQANHDYRLSGNSSTAFNTGTNISAEGVSVDAEGLTRPNSGNYDIGAHEYGALSVMLFPTNPTTYGATNGSVTASPIGGSGSYTYSWSGGGTSATKSSLGQGDHSVTVTDSASANKTTTATLVAPQDLTVWEKSTPAYDGSSDGSITLSAYGGTPPYSYSWPGGATTATVTGLAVGSYTYTVTDAAGDTAQNTLYIRDAGTPVYRVNSGGLEITDTHMNWAQDKSPSHSPYVLSGNTSTTGDANWSSTNLTEAPTGVLGTRRYTGNTALQWNFPATTDGFYEVNVFFNETDPTKAVGNRVFDVKIENNVVVDDLDVRAVSGLDRPLQYSFVAYITDDNLDLDFARVTGSPMISAIAVNRLQPYTTLIDFGSTAYPTSGVGDTWNNMTSHTVNSTLPLVDSTNVNRGMVLTVVGGGTQIFTGNNSGGMTNATVYTLNATRDSFYFDNGKTPKLTLSGMDPDRSYTFKFFGSRTGGGIVRSTKYKVIGATSGNTVNDATENTSSIATVPVAIFPTAQGNVTIDLEKAVHPDAPGNTSTSGVGYLGVMEVIAN